MVKKPGRSGRPLAEVTWLSEAPSRAQRTAGTPFVQEVPMGHLPWWGMADQGNTAEFHGVLNVCIDLGDWMGCCFKA